MLQMTNELAVLLKLTIKKKYLVLQIEENIETFCFAF